MEIEVHRRAAKSAEVPQREAILRAISAFSASLR
jgi:hypothetical protein